MGLPCQEVEAFRCLACCGFAAVALMLSAWLAAASNVAVDDPASLFGTDYTSDSFAGAGKVATITVYAVTGVAICKPDDSFLKAAGCEILTVSYAGVESGRRQIMNQADVLYYSGHGLHRFALLDDFGPSAFSGRWNRDLDCLVVSGCSILDINDYNSNFTLDPEDHVASPGKLWAVVGPANMVGYNYYAPQDETGAPTRIVREWIQLRMSYGDVDAWMRANDNRCGRNACAIKRIDDSYVRYSYFRREKGYLYNSYLMTNVIERITQ